MLNISQPVWVGFHSNAAAIIIIRIFIIPPRKEDIYRFRRCSKSQRRLFVCKEETEKESRLPSPFATAPSLGDRKENGLACY